MNLAITRKHFIAAVGCGVITACSASEEGGIVPPNIKYSALAQRYKTRQALLAVEPDIVLPAASVIKLLIAITLIERNVAQSVNNATATVTPRCFLATNRFFAGVRAGDEMAVTALLSQMIIQSDNFSANVLIEHLGISALHDMAERLQLARSRLHGLFEDTTRTIPPNVFTTARDCNKMLEHIMAGSQSATLSRRQAYLDLLNQMEMQRDRRFIPLAAAHVAVADKTGEIAGQVNDAAIINPFGSDPMLFSILIQGNFWATDPSYDNTVHELQGLVARLVRSAHNGPA